MLKLKKMSDTADIEVVHPSYGVLEHDDGRVLTFTAYSTESKQYADARNKHADRLTNINYKRMNTSEKRELSIKFLADCIKSFNNFDKVDLGHGEIDPEDKLSLLRNYSWLREFVDDEVGDLGNFTVDESESKKKS